MIQLSNAEIHRLCSVTITEPVRRGRDMQCDHSSTTAVIYFVVYMAGIHGRFLHVQPSVASALVASKPVPGSEEEGRRG